MGCILRNREKEKKYPVYCAWCGKLINWTTIEYDVCADKMLSEWHKCMRGKKK